MMYLIKHTFKYLDSEMFKLIYKALVWPHVEYASTGLEPNPEDEYTQLGNVNSELS